MKHALTWNGRSISQDIELVMMDKDGTLIDIHHYWASIIRLRAKKIAGLYFSDHASSGEIEAELIDRMGVDLKTGRMKPEGPVGIKPRQFIVQVVTDVVRSKGLSKTVEDIEAIFKIVDQETAEDMLPYLRILPGVREFLDECKTHGIKLAVVTTDITPRAKTAMTALGLDSYFDFIVGGDLVKNTKPAPDLARIVIDRTGILPEKSAVIGDHPVDIQMGMNCGSPCNIGVLTGLSDAAKFGDLPCHVVDSFEDLQIRPA